MSTADLAGVGVCLDQVVDLLDHVAFQASDDVAFGLALGPLGLSALTEGGFAGLLPRDPTQALGSHQRLDGAPGNRDALTVELSVDLAGTVDTKVGLVRSCDVSTTSLASGTARAESGRFLAA
ncbi:hypothetical protein [Corynebacterium matruchotii]|uniref:hypothetical protein n=1 Tax=Corynebacterium matruchotii TaxID=43768 RepID=UPI00242C5645|nr:hypothetical protein [Corynebacterium matruchotii]